jgi:flagellar biosynthesis protein FlhF
LGSDSRGVAARLGLPHVVAGRPAELLASARARRGLDAVLIDAPGCGARERARIEALGTFLDAVAAELPLERYLLVPATLAAAPARAVTEAYAVLAPTAIVVTKLDESTAPAAALEAARAANLPLALLCDGAALAQHLRRPKPDDLADLLLRGRLA